VASRTIPQAQPEQAPSDFEKLVFTLVIGKYHGIAKMAWENDREKFKKVGIRTLGTIQSRIRKLELADQCQKTRKAYLREIITTDLIEKHNGNYFSIAKELRAPQNEVTEACNQLANFGHGLQTHKTN